MKPKVQRDITQGSLGRNVLGLAWPITISQILFMLPNIYDTIWLGQLGPNAQAAAGCAHGDRTFTAPSPNRPESRKIPGRSGLTKRACRAAGKSPRPTGFHVAKSVRHVTIV